MRAARAGDIAAVIALERTIAEAPHWSEADYDLILSEVILSGSGLRRCLFVADSGGELGGFAVSKVILSGSEALGELESVAVRGDLRRQGVGLALCKAVADWCRAQGASVLELEVRAASAGAIALYEGLGFGRVGLRRAYYRDPVDDAMLMRLRLI